MTHEEACIIISEFCFTGYKDNKKPTGELFNAIHELVCEVKENDKLKAENEQYKSALTTWNNTNNEMLKFNQELKDKIEQLKAELEQLSKFKEYFMELYNQGLEVSNWHLNGDLEPLTNFIDSALEEAEQHLKGKV